MNTWLFRIRGFNGKCPKWLSKVVWIVLNNICLESDVKRGLVCFLLFSEGLWCAYQCNCHSIGIFLFLCQQWKQHTMSCVRLNSHVNGSFHRHHTCLCPVKEMQCCQNTPALWSPDTIKTGSCSTRQGRWDQIGNGNKESLRCFFSPSYCRLHCHSVFCYCAWKDIEPP